MHPIKQFESWFAEAQAAGVAMPEAVCLATADADGRPSARMVLFKGVADEGLTFYTNYTSRKAEQIAANPHAALVFHWVEMERQMRFEGRVAKLDAERSDAYFASRGRGSRLSAWASRQSQTVDDRQQLERQYAEIVERFEGQEVPRPDFWGGYLLTIERAEFWVGREHRFHDRQEFRLVDGVWTERRLQP